MRLFSFDRELALVRLREAAAELRRTHPDVESVTLFGSIARGDAVPGSDADVAVILRPDSPRATMRPMDRVIDLMVPFVGVGVGVDLVAFTLAEAMSGTLWASLQKEGMALA